jgi:hypothetical protein
VTCEGFRGVGDGRGDQMRFGVLVSICVCGCCCGRSQDLIRDDGFKQP